MKYSPHPVSLDDLNCRDGIFTLRGPRRVGKTVSLKLLLAQWIETGHGEGRDALWLTFDTIRTLAQAEDHLSFALDQMKPRKPRLLFIDEVSALDGWQRLIKKFRDHGRLSEIVTVLTGSSAHDIKKGAERMAGRRGKAQNPDRVLLPMGFDHFVACVRTALPGWHAQDDPAAYGRYLSCGGFPFRVERLIDCEKNRSEFDPLADYSIFDDVLFYEFARRRLDRNTALEILGRLTEIGVNAVSYQGLVKPLSFSKETAVRYLNALGDAFLLASFHTYDTSRNRVSIKKDKKFLWIDPALGELGAWVKHSPPLSEAQRVELTIGRDLLGRFENRIFEGISSPRSVFTWKSRAGSEIDFLVVDRSKKFFLPVEVKYQNSISDWDFQSMERAFGCGIQVTCNTGRKRPRAQAVPAHEFSGVLAGMTI